jgi:dipeptide transport system substrate-binding protein
VIGVRALQAGVLALAAGGAQAAGTLTVCSDGAPDGFDIVQYESLVTEDAAGITLYDKLLAFKPGTTEVAPGLAERWEISADGLVYTFHLRRGVKFHATPWFKPTRELNADDVLWSIHRVNDKAHPAHGVAKSGYAYWTGMNMPELVKSVEKLDAMTVRLTLTRPEAPVLANLAMSSIGSVYSAEYAAQLQAAGKLEDLNTQPIGTGPFVFKSYQKDAVIRYAANPVYWGGVPKIDNLIVAVTPDPAVIVQRVKAGECAAATLAVAQAVNIEGDPNLKIVRSQPLMTNYLAPNARHRFTSDKRFREALWLAIDKQSYIQAVYAGNATVAASFLAPGIWSHDSTLKNRRDPERAKLLVKSAGYDGTPLKLFAAARDGNILRGVEVLQADWARVGIKVEVQLYETGELLKRSGRGEHDIVLASWFGDNGDPDNFFTPNLSCAAIAGGGNKAQWCNKDFEVLLAQGRATADIKKRSAIYVRAQRLLYDEVGIIPMVHRPQFTAVHKRVRGFVQTPFGGRDFRGVSLDAAP